MQSPGAWYALLRAVDDPVVAITDSGGLQSADITSSESLCAAAPSAPADRVPSLWMLTSDCQANELLARKHLGNDLGLEFGAGIVYDWWQADHTSG